LLSPHPCVRQDATNTFQRKHNPMSHHYKVNLGQMGAQGRLMSDKKCTNLSCHKPCGESNIFGPKKGF
jgi:hypothetical protein